VNPIDGAADVLRERFSTRRPRVAVVLGSGLGDLARCLVDAVSVPFASLPGFPAATVAGHEGAFITGRAGGRDLLVQAGRLHRYEGHAPAVAALPVRVLARLGVTTVLLTNAAGGLRPEFVPGTLMLVADQVNLTFGNPLTGAVRAGEERFPDMSDPFDPGLRELARAVARRQGRALAEGVYAGVTGPSYETAAEIRMLRRLGADAVGMSMVHEVVAARALGLRCLGLSTITNLAAGLSRERLTHEEVLEAGRQAKDGVWDLIEGVIAGV
jgi:purine-nucleoside phosphorylase